MLEPHLKNKTSNKKIFGVKIIKVIMTAEQKPVKRECEVNYMIMLISDLSLRKAQLLVTVPKN